MKRLSLKAQKRGLLGRKVKSLRRQGIVPANIYGKKISSQAVQVQRPDFEKVFKESGETQIIDLVLEGERKPVLIHKVQRDPVDGSFIHIDFLQVDLKEKVSASVPVVGIGESPAEKQGLGTVVFYINEIEVEALPTDLPERIEVDVSVLKEVDQAILVKDLTLDRAKINLRVGDEDLVAKVEAIKEEEKVEEESATEAVETGEVKPESAESQEDTSSSEEVKSDSS